MLGLGYALGLGRYGTHDGVAQSYGNAGMDHGNAGVAHGNATQNHNHNPAIPPSPESHCERGAAG